MGGGEALYAPLHWFFALYSKISLDNPNLKFLDRTKLCVADSPMKKNQTN